MCKCGGEEGREGGAQTARFGTGQVPREGLQEVDQGVDVELARKGRGGFRFGDGG